MILPFRERANNEGSSLLCKLHQRWFLPYNPPHRHRWDFHWITHWRSHSGRNPSSHHHGWWSLVRRGEPTLKWNLIFLLGGWWLGLDKVENGSFRAWIYRLFLWSKLLFSPYSPWPCKSSLKKVNRSNAPLKELRRFSYWSEMQEIAFERMLYLPIYANPYPKFPSQGTGLIQTSLFSLFLILRLVWYTVV